MPRFVILEHDHPELHWDLMLEIGAALKTWRLPAPPPDQPATALALGNHRIDYLDYEGPVSGNRGTVKRWDAGTYEELDWVEVTEWAIELRGARWQGIVHLQHHEGKMWSVSCTLASG
jgi:DNA polymerase Ligase (LigD)